MKFSIVADYFNQIEAVSSRLKITELLAELFKKATPNEAELIAYLSLGNLNPMYIGTKFNFAEKSMLHVLAEYLDSSASSISKKTHSLGDFGLVIEQSERKHKPKDELSVLQVAKFLREFLELSGHGSQEAKEKYLLQLLKKLDPASAKYVVRIVLGKLRLGFSDMTLIDAFSWMETGDKSIRKDLETAYNTSADIGFIVRILKEDGIDKIKRSVISPGIPIRPAAAERMESAGAIIVKIGDCIAQPKLDGFRLQVHIFKKHGKRCVRFFSRNLQEMTHMFPDLVLAAEKVSVDSFICDGEAIAYDAQSGEFLPFQETVKRRRKHDIEQTVQDVPLKLYLFDLMYLNGKSVLDQSHDKRRKLLKGIFKKKESGVLIQPVEEKEIHTVKDLEEYFQQCIGSGLEGVVVKKHDSSYQPGKRNFNWIKLKREETGSLRDTIDCVVLGYYAGRGKRASFGIGALLVGVYNKKQDRFETIAKIGTGLTDVEWKAQKKACDQIAVKSKPKNVECAKSLVPDVWVSPEIVCLIRADEITLSPLHSAGATEEHVGFALRFPRLMGYRPDKNAKDATTVKEVVSLYELQFKGKKVTRKKKVSKDSVVKGQKSIF